jgi:hypothetical protein
MKGFNFHITIYLTGLKSQREPRGGEVIPSGKPGMIFLSQTALK